MVTMGLFAPLPLALMIPFMAAQSFAMGEAFGKGFQYGKRRISAMDNKEFNSMKAKDHFLETTADIKSMIPEMKQAMSSFAFLQQDIIKELIGYIKDTTGTVIEEVKDIHTTVSDDFRAFFGQPPTVAKLASPEGIRAVLSWWSGISFNPISREDIRRQLRKDFLNNQAVDNFISKFEFLLSLAPPVGGFIGPPAPTPPAGNLPPEFDQDTRSDAPPSVLPPKLIRAPSSIKTQWNKYVEEIRAIQNILPTLVASRYKDRKDKLTARIFTIKNFMRALKAKYDFGISPSQLGFDTKV